MKVRKTYGQKEHDSQEPTEERASDPVSKPVSDLRTSASLSSTFRNVPDLLPTALSRGSNPRRKEGELVEMRSSNRCPNVAWVREEQR